jgi:acetylornithine deacetylase
MQVVTAHKTKRSLRAHIKGKSCHSSLAPYGVNAVDYAAMLALKVREIGHRLGQDDPEPLYDVGVSTAHSGILMGGTALNIVPDNAKLDFEFRVLPSRNAEKLVAEIHDFTKELIKEMRQIDPDSNIEIETLSAFPGLNTPDDDHIVSLAKAFAGRNHHKKVAFGTEAGLYSAASIPTVVIGPGSIEQAHKPDEYIELEQLQLCETFLKKLIRHAS